MTWNPKVRRLSSHGSCIADDNPLDLAPTDGEEDESDNEAPETPTDEPPPIPIQDPPPPSSTGEPLTVTCPSSCPT
jgi:hypothetical protein